MPTSRVRFAPNVTAATTAVTASTVPTIALRTGTAVRPRPGSSAMRTPVATVGGRPARVAASPSREGVSLPAAMVSAPRRRDAACHAGSAARKSRRTTMTANPTPSRATFTWNPGWGSASRAGPMGISGEATAATTNASIAPTRLGPVTRAMARRKS